MADFPLGPTVFPVGTTVGAYVRRAFVGQTGPLAAAVTTAVTDANLETSFSGLAYDTAYWAAAQLEGVWRKVAFTTEPDPAATAATLANINAAIAALTKSDVGLGSADNTSDEGKPVSTATQAALDAKASAVDVAVIKEADLNVEWPEYGADAAKTAAENKVALQAAVDALPVEGGTMVLPSAYNTEPFSMAGRRSIVMRGIGGLSAGAACRSQLVHAGAAGTSIIDMQGAIGCWAEDVQVLYSDPAFAGYPIDAQDSAFCGLDRCYVGGMGGAVGAPALVRTKNSQMPKLRDTVLAGGQHGIMGKEILADFVTALSCDNVAFKEMVVANVRNPHHGWTLEGCIHQQLASGAAGGIYGDFPVYGLTVEGGWMGDANALGDWINVFGFGVYVLGPVIGAGLCGVRTDNGDTTGVKVAAQFEFCQFGYIADTGGPFLSDDIDTSGSTFNGIAAANRVVMGASQTAAPTTGEHHRGEIRWKSDPVAGDFAGWVCTASGTPGTWKTFGAISA